MSEERRVTDTPAFDPALIMGVLYTMIYAGMVSMLLFKGVPTENKQVMDVLVGAMTMIQGTVVQFFFGSTKSSRDTQHAVAVSKERTDNTMREIVASTVAPAVAEAKRQPRVIPGSQL